MTKKGFTLVELAIVLTIGGMMIAASTTVFLNFMRQSRIDETTQRMQKVDVAIKQFLRVNNRLPCPASITAGPNTSSFGVSMANCDSTGSSADSARLSGRSGLNVKIGAVPVRNLNIRDEDMLDGWGNRIFYVVTEQLTTTAGFSQTGGAIDIIDASSNTVLSTAGTVQYTIVSLGENGRGAYNINGIVATTGGKACPTSGNENTNCKFSGSATFRNALIASTRSGVDAFDDLVVYDALAVPKPISNNIPSGTIAAFNRTSCPPDWAVVQESPGRVIMGVGNYTAEAPTFNDNYPLGAIGGFANWAFTINELPSHSHRQRLMNSQQTPAESGALTLGFAPSPYSGYTAHTGFTGGTATGGGGRNLASENRQPFVAYLYCQKI